MLYHPIIQVAFALLWLVLLGTTLLGFVSGLLVLASGLFTWLHWTYPVKDWYKDWSQTLHQFREYLVFRRRLKQTLNYIDMMYDVADRSELCNIALKKFGIPPTCPRYEQAVAVVSLKLKRLADAKDPAHEL